MLGRKWRRESTVDLINLALGIGLISAPWIFGFTTVAMAGRDALITGALISVMAATALVSFSEWEEWVNLILGLWVAVSPWALSFHFLINASAVRTMIAIGFIVATLAAVELWMVQRNPPRITA